MSDRKYIKYTGARLSKGDIVNIDGNDVPFIYEGLQDQTNYYPLCAAQVDDLPRYRSCGEFLEAHNRSNDITRYEYQEKDYANTSIPVSGFGRIYLNPFEEIKQGDIIIMNGKKFIRTGNSGTATHILSAIPKTSNTHTSVKIDLTAGSANTPTNTTTTAPITAGDLILPIPQSSNQFFSIGNDITIDRGTNIEESNTVIGFGSLKLQTPLLYDHDAGAAIEIITTDLALSGTTPLSAVNVSPTPTPTPQSSSAANVSPTPTPTVTPTPQSSSTANVSPTPTPTVTSYDPYGY